MNDEDYFNFRMMEEEEERESKWINNEYELFTEEIKILISRGFSFSEIGNYYDCMNHLGKWKRFCHIDTIESIIEDLKYNGLKELTDEEKEEL